MSTSRATEIEQQLAHMRWRRLQNERAIRNALEKTKSVKQNDTMLQISVNHTNEKKAWMSSIIEDELARPLVLSDADSHKLVLNEKKANELIEKRDIENKAMINATKEILDRARTRARS